uniref:Uncharacterized protein n=1 Tax=Castor canadensis TaxID=51338 RepID=A0A8C0XJ38_CASCN
MSLSELALGSGFPPQNQSFRMSIKAPPTLLQLAGQSLLRNEALAISALQTLPMELFPPLFMEAFAQRRTEIMKAMVQAWPFPFFPLGPLMKTQDLETLQITLGGIDMLKYQMEGVLDLRTVHQNFWKVWAGNMAGYCTPQAKSINHAVEVQPRTGVKQPLRLIIDLNLDLDDLHELQIHLFEWVLQRKSSVQLCCRKMQIWGLCTCGSRPWPIHRVLSLLELNWIEEVVLHCPWSLCILGVFASYLGQMRNLRTLCISRTCVLLRMSPEQNEQLVTTFSFEFGKLSCLQQLYMNGAYFLRGHLHQVLRCLKTPLESLSITQCQLEESDLDYLSQCLSINQLKYLSLRGVTLSYVDPKPFQILLERVSDTLKILNLEDCGIRDSQLTALLPALSCCSQLTTFNFFGNHISMSVLKDLLCHTAKLSRLSQELYPVPLESYDGLGSVITERLTQHCAELLDTLRTIRKPKMVLFGTEECPQCGSRCFYDMEHHLSYCWMYT